MKYIGFTFGNRINILCFVIAKPCMRRGFAPSHIPTAGTTFPLDTLLLQRFAFFLFPRPALLYGYIARRPRIYCRARASLWLSLHRIKCFRCALALPLIGSSSIVATRETECAACHESNAAGSPSDEGAVKGGHGGLPPCGEVRRGKAPSETSLWLHTPSVTLSACHLPHGGRLLCPLPGGCQHAGGMLACSRRLSGGVSKTWQSPV